MATIPAYNPRLPFVGRIPGSGLYHGMMIRIQGRMNHTADRFNINLQNGPSINPLDEVPLHIDVRPRENVIVRNHHTRHGAGWGPEERYGGFPLRRGGDWEILILAQNRCYKIALNGQHFCEFNHRLPMSRVQFVYINGDTTVNFIRMEQDIPQIQVPTTAPTAPPYPGIHPIPAQIGGVPPPTQYVPNYAPPAYNPPGPINMPIHPSPPYNPQSSGLYSNISPTPAYSGYPTGTSSYGSGPVMMNKEYIPDYPTGTPSYGTGHVMMKKEYMPFSGK